jgi:hypothetical protein
MYNNKIGVIYPLKTLLEEGTDRLKELGIEVVQINCWDTGIMTQDNADRVKKTIEYVRTYL